MTVSVEFLINVLRCIIVGFGFLVVFTTHNTIHSLVNAGYSCSTAYLTCRGLLKIITSVDILQLG
jgi:hypothetical protein